MDALRDRSPLATTIQFFDVVSMSSEMGCIVTNVTVHILRKKKHIFVAKCERTLNGAEI